ncbi:MAG: tyrosine-protein phosphatase, partial [Raoultibacter sp.]
HVGPEDGHIELESLYNTRDLGGIETSDGRHVKPRMLIRSALLADATEHDAKSLIDDFRLRKVIDFRTEEERLKRPDPEDLFLGVSFIDIPVLNTQALGITREGGIKGLIEAAKSLEADPAEIMIKIYPSMLLNERSMQGYAAFFDELLKDEGAPLGSDPLIGDASAHAEGSVLWHCSAGKDRAGLAAALLLYVLGVPYERILADYLATNKYIESHTQEILDMLATYHMAERLDGSVRVLNSADERFLNAAFDSVKEQYGDIDTYLREALGITSEKVEALRAKYLEA